MKEISVFVLTLLFGSMLISCNSEQLEVDRAPITTPMDTLKFNFDAVNNSGGDFDESKKKCYEIKLKYGQVMDISGVTNGSVGSSFGVVCDSSFFSVNQEVEPIGNDNFHGIATTGNGSRYTYHLKSIQKGKTKVVCTGEFRGSISNVEEYFVIIE